MWPEKTLRYYRICFQSYELHIEHLPWILPLVKFRPWNRNIIFLLSRFVIQFSGLGCRCRGPGNMKQTTSNRESVSQSLHLTPHSYSSTVLPLQEIPLCSPMKRSKRFHASIPFTPKQSHRFEGLAWKRVGSLGHYVEAPGMFSMTDSWCSIKFDSELKIHLHIL